MGHDRRKRRLQAAGVLCGLLFFLYGLAGMEADRKTAGQNIPAVSLQEDYIRQVDFNVTAEALRLACETDLRTWGSGSHIDWISLLACTAARFDGEFGKQALADLENTARKLEKGESSLKEEAGRVILTFENDVSDFTRGDVEQLFRRFYVKDPSRNSHGTGLGLAIAKTLAEKTGGSMRAELIGEKRLLFTVEWTCAHAGRREAVTRAH